VNTSRISFHGALRTTRLNDNCRPHPTTVAAAPYHPHTRPPEIHAHAPTETVTRVAPARVKLARNGCLLPSAVRLSLSRYCTHRPHPCTVFTAAHPFHTRSPDVPARLVYQRLLVNTYCTSDLCRPHERSSAAADLPQAIGASMDPRRPIPADLAHAVSILGRYVHLPGLQRLAYKRIANYLLRTTAILCDDAAELENSYASQVRCRKHQAGLTPKTDAD